jgi:hypothetical protein
MRKLKLFQVFELEYERIEKDHWSQYEVKVHEHPLVSGSVGLIHCPIDHGGLPGIDAYMRAHTEYAARNPARRLKPHDHPHRVHSLSGHVCIHAYS